MIIISPLIRTVLRIASFVLYAITLISAFGGHINPDYVTIPSILTLGMQYFAIATFIVAVCWLCAKRFITGALGIITLLIGWSSIGAAVPLSFPNSAPDNAPKFTLLTFNCLHMDDIEKPDAQGNRAVEFLINSGADIICLQELEDWNDKTEFKNLPTALRDSLFALYPFQAGENKWRSDVKVLSKFPITQVPGIADLSQYENNRFAYFRIDIAGRRVGLINMHLTSYSLSDKERQVLTDVHGANSAKNSLKEFKGTIFQKLKQSFRTRSDKAEAMVEVTANMNGPLIICGDFNDVPSSWAYRKLTQAGFKDAYSETNFWPTFTYNQHLFLFHLDQIFYRGPIEALWVKKEKIKTSDHYPLMAQFALL